MKIATIIGARPQFIKSAPLSAAFKSIGIEEFTIHTGQHYDPEMSDVFFSEMNLPNPWKRFDFGQLDRLEMITSIQHALIPALRELKPDAVLVYGDTNSTLAGARAAKACQLPLVHVEAGLRSGNLEMPEELNRIETDRLSSLLFTPSEASVLTLKGEGLDQNDRLIKNVGDIMLDALTSFKPFATEPNVTGMLDGPFALATLHRAENTKDALRLEALIQELNRTHQEVIPVIMPVHPATHQKLSDLPTKPAFHMLPPLSYLEMIWMLDHSSVVLTDSGGLQKEAYYSEKRCITMRRETEWVELIQAGVNELFKPGIDHDLAKTVRVTLDKSTEFGVPTLYGTGESALQIAAEVRDYLVNCSKNA